MNNKLIIAAAGSGKTTFIIKEALKKNNTVLITTFTEANENEIKNKIIKIKGVVPSNIIIQTWFSFLLQHGARPYQNGLFNKRIDGILPFEILSPRYIKETNNGHYFSTTGKIYHDKLAKFVVKANTKNNGEVINRISKIFKNIFIDEIQDLSGNDLEILKLLFDSTSNILLVGDPRQVTYSTHHEKLHSKYKNGNIVSFIKNEYIKKTKSCIIDETSFNHSYRNISIICNFASKLYPSLPIPISKEDRTTEHDGIFLIKEKDIQKYTEKYKPKILRFMKAQEGELTYGNSKGLGFERILIYPTDKIKIFLSTGNLKDISTIIPKFYVALTRAKYSIGIIFNYKDSDDYIEGVHKWF